MSTPNFQGDGAHAGEAPVSGAYPGEAATASGAYAGANAAPAAQAGGANAALGPHAPSAPVGVAVPHESADEHVTGAALYTDELFARTQGVLHAWPVQARSEEHTSELQSRGHLVCRLLLEKKT